MITSLKILGLLIAVLLPFEALFLWESFSEVVDDGLPITGPTLFSRTLLAVAPFGLTTVIVPLLCGSMIGAMAYAWRHAWRTGGIRRN